MLIFFNPYQICIKIRVLISKFHCFNFPHLLVFFSCFRLEHIPNNSKSISKSRFSLIKVKKKIIFYKLYQNLEFVSKWYWVDSLRNSSNLKLKFDIKIVSKLVLVLKMVLKWVESLFYSFYQKMGLRFDINLQGFCWNFDTKVCL